MFSKLLSILLPVTCALCHELSGDQAICKFCIKLLPWQDLFCPCCATPLSQQQLCGQCIKKPPAFDFVLAPLCYEFPLQYLITQLKFHNKIRYANALSELVLPYLQQFYACHTKPQLILPVPLSKQRLQERGYNQALEIAKPLAKALSIPIEARLLIKSKHSLPQSELSFKQRTQNVKNCFALRSAINVDHIALVDDVVTTASTVNEVAKMLKLQGVKRIDVWCVARTG